MKLFGDNHMAIRRQFDGSSVTIRRQFGDNSMTIRWQFGAIQLPRMQHPEKAGTIVYFMTSSGQR